MFLNSVKVFRHYVLRSLRDTKLLEKSINKYFDAKQAWQTPKKVFETQRLLSKFMKTIEIIR